MRAYVGFLTNKGLVRVADLLQLRHGVEQDQDVKHYYGIR